MNQYSIICDTQMLKPDVDIGCFLQPTACPLHVGTGVHCGIWGHHHRSVQGMQALWEVEPQLGSCMGRKQLKQKGRRKAEPE